MWTNSTVLNPLWIVILYWCWAILLWKPIEFALFFFQGCSPLMFVRNVVFCEVGSYTSNVVKTVRIPYIYIDAPHITVFNGYRFNLHVAPSSIIKQGNVRNYVRSMVSCTALTWRELVTQRGISCPRRCCLETTPSDTRDHETHPALVISLFHILKRHFTTKRTA